MNIYKTQNTVNLRIKQNGIEYFDNSVNKFHDEEQTLLQMISNFVEEFAFPIIVIIFQNTN